MDLLTVESGKNNKDMNILVVTDLFTKYSQAYVTSSQTAQVVAKTLCEKFFMHFGMPEKLLNDQGRNFESQLVFELCTNQCKEIMHYPISSANEWTMEMF